jgi:hypothetical protein
MLNNENSEIIPVSFNPRDYGCKFSTFCLSLNRIYLNSSGGGSSRRESVYTTGQQIDHCPRMRLPDRYLKSSLFEGKEGSKITNNKMMENSSQ